MLHLRGLNSCRGEGRLHRWEGSLSSRVAVGLKTPVRIIETRVEIKGLGLQLGNLEWGLGCIIEMGPATLGLHWPTKIVHHPIVLVWVQPQLPLKIDLVFTAKIEIQLCSVKVQELQWIVLLVTQDLPMPSNQQQYETLQIVKTEVTHLPIAQPNQ